MRTTSASYRANSTRDSLTLSMIRRYRAAFICGTELQPATSEADAWRYAVATGDLPDPAAHAGEEDEEDEEPVLVEPAGGYWLRPAEAPAVVGWWTGIEDVAARVMLTVSTLECFRDDILAFDVQLRAVRTRDRRAPAVRVHSFTDHAVHAALVNDCAFGIAPGEQMEAVVGWLTGAFWPLE
jgi:hypothetical protein